MDTSKWRDYKREELERIIKPENLMTLKAMLQESIIFMTKFKISKNISMVDFNVEEIKLLIT